MTKDERRIIAEKHFDEMQNRKNIKCATEYSIKHTKVYDGVMLYDNDVDIIDSTTENAILQVYKKTNESPCVLNFASFTRPGGGFIKGSIAQEESLCHVSNLYNVLLAFKDEYDKNYNRESFKSGTYNNWALYSDSVYFEINNQQMTANVITCAAPNYKKFIENGGTNLKGYDEVLYSRIKYILDIAKENDQKILILGAFGCGVFGNNPTTVATHFKSLLRYYNFDKVIFAIPNNQDGNYNEFKRIFSK